MGKWLEISIEEDRYGNCINREERADIFIDVIEKDNYTPPIYKDSHYMTKTSTYFYKKLHFQHITFYYKIIEAVYNEKNDLIRETTKNLDGKITKEILYDYKFDEFDNKTYKVIRTRIDNEYAEEITIRYTYDNKYNEYGQLIKSIKKVVDGETIFTRKYKYKNKKLDKIETYDSNNVLYRVSELYYTDDGYEEKIFSFGELSSYNQYLLVEDKRYRKIMLSPIKGKYKWSLDAEYIEKGIMKVNIFEPILIPDATIEVLEYLTEKYDEKIKSVIIKKHDILDIGILQEELERLHKIYYYKYKLDIKYC
jgi:hypothetical protein